MKARIAIVSLVLIGLLFAARTAVAAVYLVDQANPAAADTNAGAWDSPWKTIGKAAKAVKPGDTVYVAEGVYDERVKLEVSGTETQPISFIGTPARAVVMKGFEVPASRVRIRGFHVTSAVSKVGSYAYDGGFFVNGDHVEVTDNLVTDLNAAISGKGKHVRVRHNRFYKCQISVVVSGEDWLFDGNEIDRVFQHIEGSDCDYMRMWGKGHVIRCGRFHGTTRAEVGKAHLDILQTWVSRDYHLLQDILFEKNHCEVFSQGTMMSCDIPGHLARMVFRENVYWKGGSWGLNINGVQDVTVTNNTFATIGIYGPVLRKGSTGVLDGNLCVDIGSRAPTRWYDRTNEKVGITDALFVDSAVGNFRLKPGSPCIGAGKDGTTVGALAYPNTYYVDGGHPGADDKGFGYPGWPFKTITAALAMASAGETVIVRGGVYRETVKPKAGVAVRVWEGEQVLVSPMDEVTGWRRDGDGWSVTLPVKPTRVLKGGLVFTGLAWDDGKKTLTVTGFDPRLFLMETIVRAPEPVNLFGR